MALISNILSKLKQSQQLQFTFQIFPVRLLVQEDAKEVEDEKDPIRHGASKTEVRMPLDERTSRWVGP